MATTQYDSELNKLEEQEKKLDTSFRSSNTAFSGSTPSNVDLYKETQIRELKDKINETRDKQLDEMWFSEDKTGDSTGVKTGLFGKALDSISMPIYGLVGAIETAVGKGTQQGFAANINKNMKEGHRTFGDLLSRSGTPSGVAAPVGFALDVMFDPINWATAGTTALIPRIATGVVKGGLRGGEKAVVSSALQSASTAGRWAGKVAPSIKKTKTFLNLTDKAFETSQEFNKIINKDVIEAATKNRGIGFGSDYRITLRDIVKSAASAIPGGYGDDFLETLDLDNARWIRLARIKDSLEKSFGTGDHTRKQLRAIEKGDNKEIRESFENARKAFIAKTFNVEPSGSILELPKDLDISEKFDAAKASRGISEIDLSSIIEELGTNVGEAKEILNDVDDIFRTADPVENAFRIASEKTYTPIDMTDVKAILDSGILDETGIKWFDNTKDKVKKWNFGVKVRGKEVKMTGENALDAFSSFISIFKRAKVAGSPSAWTNAIVGNPVMAWMAGINIMDPSYISEVSNAYKMVRGTDSAEELLKGMMSDEMMEYFRNNGKEFSRTFGQSPEFLAKKASLEKMFYQAGRDAGLIKAGEDGEKILQQAFETIEDAKKNIVSVAEKGDDLEKMTYSSETDRLLADSQITRYDLPGNLAAEIKMDSKSANKMFNAIAEKAKEEGNYGAKLVDLVFNKALSGYEKIDQIYKLGTFRHLTGTGVTENELNTLSRIIDFTKDDILNTKNVDGVARYSIAPEKATEIVNEIYLNYQAMPSAVRMIRQLPLVGSPFASFMYGMSLKTMETAAYNPSIFNKVNYGIQEFGGEKGPLEEKALQSKYSNYLNDPAMFRLPFFEKNPIYVNLANVLPYYSLNMFNPTERPYEDTIPSALVEIIDKSPLMDDPVGQVLFDYMILPLIIRDSVPMGSFGQPVYPKGATVGDKAFYASRSFADALTPGVASYAGLAVPSKYANLLPGHRTRQLSNAKEGKTSYGKTSKEGALPRTFRSLLSSVGVPVQTPVNLEYAESDFKKGN